MLLFVKIRHWALSDNWKSRGRVRTNPLFITENQLRKDEKAGKVTKIILDILFKLQTVLKGEIEQKTY